MPSETYSKQPAFAAPPAPVITQGMAQTIPLQDVNHNTGQLLPCLACGTPHPVGYCPLKFAKVEHCPLCGIAHYGHQRTCPHLNSITQCRGLLAALKDSRAPSAEIEQAKKYIVGIIGDLQRRKKIKEKAALQSNQHTFASEQANGPSSRWHSPLQAPPRFGARPGDSATHPSNVTVPLGISGSRIAVMNGPPNGTQSSKKGEATRIGGQI